MKKKIVFVILLLMCLRAAAQVDTAIGITVPAGESKDVGELAHYLCDNLHDDRLKANAIYNWITHNIKYDMKAAAHNSLAAPDAAKVLKQRKAVCGGYALLFVKMCHDVGLKAIEIDGYAKDWSVDNGDQMYLPRHGWAAVLINGKWQLTDPTWGAGGMAPANSTLRKILNKIVFGKLGNSRHMKFEFEYNPAYFAADCREFRLKHLPSDPVWQLTDTLMPLAFFESGDSAVRCFNAISKPVGNSSELMRVYDLDDEHQRFEIAERAYRYNSKYSVALALQYIYHAKTKVDAAFGTDSAVKDAAASLSSAKTDIKKSQEYIKMQKQVFPDEYRALNKKNSSANQEAKRSIREIKTASKKLGSQGKKYGKTATTKKSKLTKRFADARKRENAIDPAALAKVNPATKQKTRTSPEMAVIEDSLGYRKRQADTLERQIGLLKNRIERLKQDNSQRLDSFVHGLGESDSLLVSQTQERFRLHDSYNDKVVAINNRYKLTRFDRTDTLRIHYMANFDTINKCYDDLARMQAAQMDRYKKNLAALKQEKKWNSADPAVDENYAACTASYAGAIDSFKVSLAGRQEYLDYNKKLFGVLYKEGVRDVKICTYMEKAEQYRTKLKKSSLKNWQALDNKENQRQQGIVKKLQKQLDNVTDKISG